MEKWHCRFKWFEIIIAAYLRDYFWVVEIICISFVNYCRLSAIICGLFEWLFLGYLRLFAVHLSDYFWII